jgi:hypothetical protein
MMIVVLNQAGTTEPRSTPHRQRQEVQEAEAFTKHSMTLATRGVAAYIL